MSEVARRVDSNDMEGGAEASRKAEREKIEEGMMGAFQ